MSDTSLRMAPIHMALLDQLHVFCDPKGIDVVDGFIGQGEDIGRMADGESVKPTVVLVMGTAGWLQATSGIGNYSDDMNVFTFSVLCVTGTNYQLTQAMDVARAALEDFMPTPYCSQIEVIAGSVPRTPVATMVNPRRYANPLGSR